MGHEASCHKQDSLMRGVAAFVVRGRPTTHKCYSLGLYSICLLLFINWANKDACLLACSTVKMLMTRDGPAVIDAKATCWSRIAIFAYPHLYSTPPLGGSILP